MFKFDFDLDDLDDEFAQIPIASAQKSVQETHIQLQPFAEIPISQLVRRTIVHHRLLLQGNL